MRGLIPGATAPSQIASALPAMYADDEFAGRLTDALDEVTAPLHTSLDSLDAYVDPLLAPADYLQWLASWVGVTADLRGADRASVAGAAGRHAVRGTPAGLLDEVVRVAGVSASDVEISEPGGVTWSASAGVSVTAAAAREVRVRVRGTVAEQEVLRAVVVASVPLHLRVRLDVLDPLEESS